MAKYLAVVDVELIDITADIDGDGTYAAVTVLAGAYLPTEKCNADALSKSLHSGALKRAIDAGMVTVVAESPVVFDIDDIAERVGGMATIIEALANRVLAEDTKVVFTNSTDTATASATVAKTETFSIQNANSVIDTFSNDQTATIVATAGSATCTLSYLKTDGTYTTAVTGSPATAGQVVPIINGVGTLKVIKAASGTVTLTITANSKSLSQSSTCVITYS